MREKGLIKDIFVNDQPFKIGMPSDYYKFVFESPLIGIQSASDMSKMDNYLVRMSNIAGANTQRIIDLPKLVTWYAEEANIPLELIKSEDQIQLIMQEIETAAVRQHEQLIQEQLQKEAQAPTQPISETQNRLEDLAANVL